MTVRKAITDKMKWECLLYRYEIPCAGCGERIMIEKDVIQWDHVWEVADDGPHTFTNLRPLHVECHKLKSAIAESQRSRIDRLVKAKRNEAITSNPEIMGGQWCIAGTRIPAIAIKHFHKDGYTIGAIIDEYPTLTREQVQAAIDFKAKRERKIQSRPFQRKAG